MNTYKINDIVNIPLDTIRVNPFQPRKIFTQDEIDTLAESIKNFGVIQPISVRRKDDHFELIIGERRLRASKAADMKFIPAVVVDADDEESALVALIENVQRVDLSYLEEAEAMKRLMDDHDLTQKEVAEKLGLKQSTVSNKLRLLNLSDEIKMMLVEHRLSERHGRALLKIENNHERMKIMEKIINQDLTVKRTEELIDIQIGKREKEEKKKRMKNYKYRINYKIYVNSLKQTYQSILDKGVNAGYHESDNEDHIEIKIIIPKE